MYVPENFGKQKMSIFVCKEQLLRIIPMLIYTCRERKC